MQGRSNEDIAKVIARGRDAYTDYTLVNDKIQQFRDEIYTAFSKTGSKQDLERHNLWQALQIADKVLEYLTTDITNGKQAIKYLDEIKRTGKPSLMERILP